MSPSGFTEDELVEQPAINLFQELGWEHASCYEEFQGGESSLGRETQGDVVLVERLRSALERLNPELPDSAIEEAIEELRRDRTRMSIAAANQDVYELLKEGVRVEVTDEDGDDIPELVRVVGWDEPDKNDFLLCSQMWISGEMHKRRPDLIGFVNGLPLIFIELKASHRRLETAYNDNFRDYKDTIPRLFAYNALVILSNGSDTKVGSVTAGWEHFSEWKKISSEEETPRVSLETAIRGTSDPRRLLDIVENFTLFMEVKGGLAKLVAKNHQYLGVNNAVQALVRTKDLTARGTGQGEEGKLGVFWHTQGSGKSISMIFFAQKVLRKIPGNWTFVLVTDRQELDDQLYRTFQSTGAVTEGHVQAESAVHLRQLLSEDHRYVFTLIHKFRTEPGERHPVVSERDDIIVITDEAHRTQYDVLAMNMRNALPNASFLAFTGTPLIAEEEKTREVFGDYVSIYDFKQSIEDDSTVPLYYENRIPEIQLTNPDLDEEIWEAIDEAGLDEASEKRLERELGRDYHLITREDRIDKVAQDIVEHFPSRGFKGKGMVVCIDKATALRMHDRVRHHWDRKIEELEQEIEDADGSEKDALKVRLAWMKQTEMSVVVSQAQNEIADMAERGLDIRPHRRRMENQDMEERFKDPEDPFRLVFVCAMWMTGFDVPSCSTIYLDKPMRNHTLMQTIARANRVYPGKQSGIIVDYVGVFRDLEKALAIYGSPRSEGGEMPVQDKEALVDQLDSGIEDALSFCESHSVDVEAIQAAEGFDRIAELDDARDSLVKNDDVKAEFLSHARYVNRLYEAVLPDSAASEYADDVSTLSVLAEKIRTLEPEPDISGVMNDIEEVLDRSIAAEGYVIDVPTGPEEREHLVDISGIDFDALEEAFGSHKAAANQKAKAAIKRRVQQMVEKNRTRMDYLERFQEMIDEYNAGSVNQEEFFRRLREFSEELDAEAERHVREGLSEEELAVFDLLTKPDVNLTEEERDEVKNAARELLSRLKEEKLKLDWRKHQRTRAEVWVTVEETLDETLPTRPYGRQVFSEKCNEVFQHVYDAYGGAGESVYA